MSTPSLQALSRELGDGGREWTAILALLGPPGAGKTSVLQGAVANAGAAGHRAIYVDLSQAREIWRLDEFYGWLLARLRDGFGGNGAIKPQARRVDTVDAIGKALGRSRERVLLVLDHLESVADWCARELVSDLREIQDQSDGRVPWNRLRCVVAGVSSVLELKRRARSPNLQFVVRTLPAWTCAPDDVAAATRELMLEAGIAADDHIGLECGAMCGAEATFLRTLLDLRRRQNGESTAGSIVESLLGRAGEYPEFVRPGVLYLIDDEFRRRADDLLAGRPAVWSDPGADIDRYQLAGAFVCGDPLRREVRFRNRLVEQFIKSLGAARPLVAAGGGGGVEALRRLQARLQDAPDLASMQAALEAAWQIVSGYTGRVTMLIGRRDRKGRHLLRDEQVAFAVAERRAGENETIEMDLRTARLRCCWSSDHWAVDFEAARDALTIGVRVDGCIEWIPSVAGREVCRLWATFVEPFLPGIERVSVEALGRAAALGRLPGCRVFLSSTSADLREQRRAVRDQISRLDLRFRGMEHFGADPEGQCPADKCREAVRQADVYVGIFGMRYGSRDPETGLSMTEVELLEAEDRSDMPMLIYVLSRTARVQVSDIEADDDGRRRLDKLIARLRARYVVFQFESVEELAMQVYQDLNRLVA